MTALDPVARMANAMPEAARYDGICTFNDLWDAGFSREQIQDLNREALHSLPRGAVHQLHVAMQFPADLAGRTRARIEEQKLRSRSGLYGRVRAQMLQRGVR